MIGIKRGDYVELKSYEECTACCDIDALPPKRSRVWSKKRYFIAEVSGIYYKHYKLFDADWWFPESCIKEVVYNDAILD